ncbi:hypothetical protein PF010_g4442 [Phytophthora fragariae]|uniref:Uncharacterized protein n=1 Tax=Phytophthora fragariae TaxID=53985 RepID=A0A6A3LWN3_9STRA|nr:hypothetical protein PF011_g4420 [Phytophthora fragariae]KAE9128578.1 hypothetical protein PF010_g4442 [Phytophthora fragariae]
MPTRQTPAARLELVPTTAESFPVKNLLRSSARRWLSYGAMTRNAFITASQIRVIVAVARLHVPVQDQLKMGSTPRWSRGGADDASINQERSAP